MPKNVRKLLPGLVHGEDLTEEERDKVLELGKQDSKVSVNSDELGMPTAYERPTPKAGPVPKPEEDPLGHLPQPGLNKTMS